MIKLNWDNKKLALQEDSIICCYLEKQADNWCLKVKMFGDINFNFNFDDENLAKENFNTIIQGVEYWKAKTEIYRENTAEHLTSIEISLGRM